MSYSIQVARLFLHDTGTYDRQYARPYEAVTNRDSEHTLSILADRIDSASRLNPAARIDNSLIAGLSGGLIIPSASWEREVTIENGWEERRLRFMLEVHVDLAVGGTEIYYIQGYTSHYGVTFDGAVDTEMTFFINSVMRVNRARDYSGLSSAGFTDRITDSFQIINGHAIADSYTPVYAVRPEDLIVGIQSSYMTSAYSATGRDEVVETRHNHQGESFSSRRGNGIPSNYLSSVIDRYRESSLLADFGQGQQNIYDRTIQTLHERAPYENAFIRALSDRRGMRDITFFNMRDLIEMDPEIQSRVRYFRCQDAGLLPQRGQSASWQSAGLYPQLATILTHGVSGLMVENMLVEVSFTSTNMTLNGMYDTRIQGGQGITTGDMRQYFANFVRRLELEVMPDVTRNNSIPIHVSVQADLYGDTIISISVENDPPEDYIVPSFSDALLVPVTTTQDTTYHGLVNGIEHVIRSCAPQPSAAAILSAVPI